MSQDIGQFYGPSWAPATFVTVNGTPMMHTAPPRQLQFNPSVCRPVFPDPYYFQQTWQPDLPYFKRWQCRANAYLENFNAKHPNVPGYRGQSPY